MTKNIQTKFSIKQVVVIPIILIIVVCILCAIITFASLEMTKDSAPLYKTPIWIVILFILILIWYIRFFLKTFKRYTFFDRGFEVTNVFGKEFHSWKTVKEISIIENNYEKILWQYMEEDALSIHLKGDKTLELFSKYYKNMPEIRLYISNQTDFEVSNSYSNATDSHFQPFKKRIFSGSFLISFNGFLIIFFTLLASFMLWHSWSSMTLVGLFVLIGIPITTTLIFSFQSYYFALDKKYLYIRNHIFFSSEYKINLEEVRVVIFEQKFKKEPSIRIINKDFSMLSYQSNSLKEKQWKSFMLSLNSKGIIIIDEMFYQ